MNNATIQGWLTQLVPLAQILQICRQLLLPFILLAAMIVVTGYIISLVGSDEASGPSVQLLIIIASIVAAPFFVTIIQQIVGGLVAAIAAADPQLNWLMVNNPGGATLAMNFTKPFGILGQYIAGATGPAPAASLMELGKWPDYLMRLLFIGLTGIVAAVTVFIMQVMLIIQWIIVTTSGPILPLFIALLTIPAAHGSAQNFLKALLAVMCWPIGWALVHVGTMAGLQNLQPPSWNASLGQLLLAFIAAAVVCLWMVLGTIIAPALIAYSVTRGTNFAAGLVGSYTSAAGQHASRAIETGSTVAGALVGSPMGPAGVALGANMGSMAGKFAAAPITSATESAEGGAAMSAKGDTGASHIIPSSRSAAAADLALKEITRRS